MEIAFAIPGPPQTWKRVNIVNGRPMTAKGQREWFRHVRSCAANAVRLAAWWPSVLEDGGVRFSLTLGDPEPTARRGDLSNYQKGIEDACNGVLWHDDRQIDHTEVKRWPPDAERPGVSVLVRVLP